MTVLTFLGIVDISDSDDFGTINLKLALDLHDAIRTHSSELMIEEKAENIIEICCEQMLDNLIEFYDWHPGEIEYANFVYAKCVRISAFELLEIAKKRITHPKKRERQTKLRIEDIKVGAMLAYVMNVHNLLSDRLENAFRKEHGAMYFDS